MLHSVFRSGGRHLRRAVVASSSGAGGAGGGGGSGRREQREEQRQQGGAGGGEGKWFRWQYSGPLLGLSWMVTVKDFLGIEQAVQLDKDPLKEKIKQSWLDRKYGKYDAAIMQLELALEEARERKEELPITRVYDELANTYYQAGRLDKAEEMFRVVIGRLMELHGKRDADPEFIGVSLKLADILAQKGQVDNAESGYKHCVRKQMQVMETHMRKYSTAHGALVEEKHLVDAHGASYTDPIALFGMALESYAHFLINFRDETREKEAEEYMDEVLKISYQIYGANAFHTMNLLNNVGAAAILKNRFALARKYLSIGADRIVHINECSTMLPGYYCNYAEALWHTGDKEKALEWARKAVTLSRSEEPRIQQYCKRFLEEMQKDANKGKKGWLW